MKNNDKSYNFGDCSQNVNDTLIVCKEQGAKSAFRGVNEQHENFLKVRVDGCLDVPNKKCDYLLINTDKNEAHFIELKGQDINQAAKQLENSIKHISNPQNGFIQKVFSKIKAYVVFSNGNPKARTDLENIKRQFKRDLKTDFVAVKNGTETDLNKL